MKRTGKLFVFLMSMALITNSGCAKTSQKEMIISADYPFYDTVEDAKMLLWKSWK